MALINQVVTGVFLKEGKTRFVAEVEVAGKVYQAYVPMSTKLSRYLDPVGRKVRLVRRGNRYWVEQIFLRRKWIWVDASKAVELLKLQFERQGKVVETEKTVKGYRFDLWCEGVGYEVKCLLSDEAAILYPNAVSQRREEQLKRLTGLVKKGTRVVWAFVALSPSSLIIDTKVPFGRAFNRAKRAGLEVQFWQVKGRGLTAGSVAF